MNRFTRQSPSAATHCGQLTFKSLRQDWGSQMSSSSTFDSQCGHIWTPFYRFLVFLFMYWISITVIVHTRVAVTTPSVNASQQIPPIDHNWCSSCCFFLKWTAHRVGHIRICFENSFKYYLTSIYHHILLRLCPSLFTLVGAQRVQDDLEASVDACTVITLQACSLSRSDASLFAVLFCFDFL